MTMISPPECGDVGERTRKTLIVKRRIGPPRPVEEPKVPVDIEMLRRRRDPLIERLEKVRDSTNLQLSQSSRDAIAEAIAVLHKNGWDM